MGTLVFSYPYHQGISPFDPGEYLRHAMTLLHCEWKLDNIYGDRIGVYAPIALAIKLFGFTPKITWISTFELAIFVCALYFFLRKYNFIVAAVSAALIAWLPEIVVSSGKLMGDVLAMVTANLCILWVWYARDIRKAYLQIIAGIFLSAIWYFSFLVKESAFFYLIPLFLLCVHDFYRKTNTKFWWAAIISGFFFGVIFLLAYYLKTGDVLYRLHALEAGPNVSEANYAQAPVYEIFLRLSFEPLKFLVENFSYFLVFFLGLIHAVSNPQNRSEKFFNFFMLSVLACWWLGTQSFARWNPVALVGRIWLPVIVPLSINAAHVIYYIYINQTDRYRNRGTLLIAAVFALGSCLIPYLNANNVFWHQNILLFLISRFSYLAVFLILIYRPLLIQEMVKQNLVILFTFSALLYYNFTTVKDANPTDSDYFAEIEIIDLLKHQVNPVVLIGEKQLVDNHGIYNGFDDKDDSSITYVPWNGLVQEKVQILSADKPLYLIVNDNRLWYTKNKYTETMFYAATARENMDIGVPEFVLHPGPKWKLVKKNTRVSLYRFLPPPSQK